MVLSEALKNILGEAVSVTAIIVSGTAIENQAPVIDVQRASTSHDIVQACPSLANDNFSMVPATINPDTDTLDDDTLPVSITDADGRASLEGKILQVQGALNEGKSIFLDIDSAGGYTFSFNRLADIIEDNESSFVSYINPRAYSAATFLAIIPEEGNRYINGDEGLVIVHPPTLNGMTMNDFTTDPASSIENLDSTYQTIIFLQRMLGQSDEEILEPIVAPLQDQEGAIKEMLVEQSGGTIDIHCATAFMSDPLQYVALSPHDLLNLNLTDGIILEDSGKMVVLNKEGSSPPTP